MVKFHFCSFLKETLYLQICYIPYLQFEKVDHQFLQILDTLQKFGISPKISLKIFLKIFVLQFSKAYSLLEIHQGRIIKLSQFLV